MFSKQTTTYVNVAFCRSSTANVTRRYHYFSGFAFNGVVGIKLGKCCPMRCVGFVTVVCQPTFEVCACWCAYFSTICLTHSSKKFILVHLWIAGFANRYH